MKLRNMSVLIVALAEVLLVSSGATLAQPTRETDEGVFVTLPDRVEMHPDGRMEVVTREVGPIPHGADKPAVPDSIPVWTSLDGRWVRGVSSPQPAFETHERPGTVFFDEGGYRLTRLRLLGIACFHSAEREEKDRLDLMHLPLAPPIIDGSETAPVRRSVTIEKPRGARGADFDFIYQPEEGTYPPGQTDAIRAALSRVETRMEQLLANNAGFCRIAFSFSDLGVPPGTSAFTFVTLATDSYTLAKNNLLIHAQVDKEPNIEITMYDQLPLGGSLQVKYTGVAQTAVSLVDVATALRLKWGFGRVSK
jgi:hypothetical protein